MVLTNFTPIKAALREEIGTEGKPRDLHALELSEIIIKHLGTIFETYEDKMIYHRFQVLASGKKLNSDRKYCANVELVRHNILAPRVDRSKGKKSAESNLPTSADPGDLAKFLRRIGILPSQDTRPKGMCFEQHAETAEARAKIMDECARNHLENGIITHPEFGIVKDDEDERRGNAKRSTMYYLTGAEMIKCIGMSANATALQEFFTVRCAVDAIYSKIYKKLLNKYTERVEQEGVAKDDNIARLEAKIDEILGHTKDVKISLDEANDKIDDLKVDNNHLLKEVVETKETVKDVEKMLVEKSLVSTRNPDKPELVNHAVVMEKQMGDGYVITLRSGQDRHLEKSTPQLEAEGYTILNDKFSQANGVDLRRNIEYAVNQRIEEVLEEVNRPVMKRHEQLKTEIEESNAKLPQEIEEYNNKLAIQVAEHNKTAVEKKDIVKLMKNGKRYYWHGVKTYANVRFYQKEERIFEKEVRAPQYQLILRALPITVSAMYIHWKPNDYISYEEIKAIIEKVNIETQASPRSSFDENDKTNQ